MARKWTKSANNNIGFRNRSNNEPSTSWVISNLKLMQIFFFAFRFFSAVMWKFICLASGVSESFGIAADNDTAATDYDDDNNDSNF